MDTTAHPARVPVFRLLAIGSAAAFAYLLLALLMGFGSGEARADDASDRGGVVSGVTDVVNETAGGVTDFVQSTTQTVTTAVQQVVPSAPAPVQPVVSPVTETVQAVAQPVAQAAETGFVGAVVAPVVDAVVGVPAVGAVVQSTGLDKTVTDVASTADGTVGQVVSTVSGTATAIGGTRPPLVNFPDIESPAVVPGAVSASSVADALHSLASVAAVAASGVPLLSGAVPGIWDAYTHTLPVFTAITATGTAAAGLVSTGAQMGGILSSALALGVCAPGGSSPLGSNGAGPGALALAAFAPLVAYRAWMRRNGWNDDVAPPAPTYDTDVSPD